MIHHTVGVYPNGPRKTNGVSSENIASHIWYNQNFRPGRALFVDGYCVHRAGFARERIEEIEKELKEADHKATRDTAPYQ